MLERQTKRGYHDSKLGYANLDVRDFGSLERLPKFADSLEKKILYALIVNVPRKFCAPSLVAVVGYSVDDIRVELESLSSAGFLMKEPIPDTLKISVDTHYYSFIEKKFESAIIYLFAAAPLASI